MSVSPACHVLLANCAACKVMWLLACAMIQKANQLHLAPLQIAIDPFRIP